MFRNAGARELLPLFMDFFFSCIVKFFQKKYFADQAGKLVEIRDQSGDPRSAVDTHGFYLFTKRPSETMRLIISTQRVERPACDSSRFLCYRFCLLVQFHKCTWGNLSCLVSCFPFLSSLTSSISKIFKNAME